MAAYKVIIRDTAVYDAIMAYDWYESCAPGLGERFLFELEKIYSKLSARPQTYGYTDGQEGFIFRDARIPHFPYWVIFEILNDEVYVHAVFHARRQPEEKWAFRQGGF